MSVTTPPNSFPELWQRLREGLNAYDVYTAAIMAVYSLLALVYYPYIPNASSVILLNALLISTVATLVLLRTYTDILFINVLRYFYIVPVIYLMYDQTHIFVRVVHPVDYDDLLILADRWLFGVDPTHWFEQFSMPALTEYLQICYFLFYLMPIMQAAELWTRGEVAQLERFARGIAFCYFISYLLYFAMPAIGPRFTLHEFEAINFELPGLFFTDALRSIIDSGGGVTHGAVSPADLANRDCMPSGHTMLTLANIILGFRNRSRYRWWFFVIGGSLIISTVYLRYHYAIDIVVGVILAIMVLPLEPKVNRWLERGKLVRI